MYLCVCVCVCVFIYIYIYYSYIVVVAPVIYLFLYAIINPCSDLLKQYACCYFHIDVCNNLPCNRYLEKVLLMK